MNPRRAVVEVPSAELVVLGEDDGARPLSAPPAAAALAPWAIDRVDGMVAIGDRLVHPLVARDVYVRLGAVLDAADRDDMHEDWTRLARDLDREYQFAVGATARVVGADDPAPGLLFRNGHGEAFMRLATYSIAVLRPRRRGEGRETGPWEGSVYALRVTSLGCERRRMGLTVRLAGAVVLSAPVTDEFGRLPVPGARQLPGPAPRPAPRPRLPPKQPARSDELRERMETNTRIRGCLLDVVAVGQTMGLDAFLAAVPLGAREVRAHLGVLVEDGVLVESGDDAWRRPRRRGRPKLGPPAPAVLDAILGVPAAEVTQRPQPSSVQSPRAARSRRAAAVAPPPGPPPLPWKSCPKCNTAARAATCVACGSTML